MAAPIVFISHHKVKEGKLDAYLQLYQKALEEIKATKPGTLTHSAYTTEDRTEVTHIHIILDADAMDLHLQGVSDRTKLAYQYIEPRAMELYGQLSDHTMEKFKQIADSGVEVAFTPQYHGGYLRLASG